MSSGVVGTQGVVGEGVKGDRCPSGVLGGRPAEGAAQKWPLDNTLKERLLHKGQCLVTIPKYRRRKRLWGDLTYLVESGPRTNNRIRASAEGVGCKQVKWCPEAPSGRSFFGHQ